MVTCSGFASVYAGNLEFSELYNLAAAAPPQDVRSYLKSHLRPLREAVAAVIVTALATSVEDWPISTQAGSLICWIQGSGTCHSFVSPVKQLDASESFGVFR